MKLYIDGKLVSATALAKAKAVNAEGSWLLVSNEKISGERLFEGAMEFVKIYGSALSEGSIRKNDRLPPI